MKSETLLWMQYADQDRQTMHVLWEKHMYGPTVLHAQQCCEKIIKAYIIERTSNAPRRIHHLEALLTDADLALPNGISMESVIHLSKGFARSRYPDLDTQHYSNMEQVEPLVITADAFYTWIHILLTQ